MMGNLRTKTNHIVFKIILTLIILSLIATGASTYLITDSRDYAAKVNDQTIELAQLDRVFQNEYRRVQDQLGEQFFMIVRNEDHIRQMRKRVLSQLIDNVLLAQYAKKLGLTVSDEQIKNIILKSPVFQNDGQFDNRKYLNVISLTGGTADRFAEAIRQKLLNQNIIESLINSNFVLPAELQVLAELMFQQRDVRLATLNLSAFQTKQSLREDELKIYYQQNRSDFIAPEQIKIDYIPIDAKSMEDKVKVNDADIIAYYDRNKINYSHPERKNYSIIQLNTQREAEAVLNELKNGRDFSNLAKEKSTDIISRRSGGELGWVEERNATEELKRANLTEKNQLSGVIESTIGYLIVRLNDIKPQKLRSLKEIHDTIAQQVRKGKARDAYDVLQQQVKTALNGNNESLKQAEKIIGIKATQTKWFTRENIPEALRYSQLAQLFFDNSLSREGGAWDSSPRIISVGNTQAFIVRVIGHKSESIQPFNTVKSRVVDQVRHNKALIQAKSEGEQLLVKLRRGIGEKAMKVSGFKFSPVQKMTADSEDNPLVESIFSLPHPEKGKPVYGISQDHQDNVVLIELDAVKPGSLPNDKTKEAFIRTMEQSTAGINLHSLLVSLRKDAKIKIGDTEQY